MVQVNTQDPSSPTSMTEDIMSSLEEGNLKFLGFKLLESVNEQEM